METIIRVLFSNEADAYKSQKALEQLDYNAELSLGESYVITRPEGGGTAEIKSTQGESFGEATLGGVVIGGLVGLLGGPIGVLIGSSMGMLAGVTTDLVRSDDTDEYLDEFAKHVPPGKTLLVAHVWEDYLTPVDVALEPLHGQVSRYNVDEELRKASDLEDARLSREIAQADRDWQESSDAARADRKARLDDLKTRRDEVRSRVETQIEQQKQQYQGWLDGQRTKFDAWKSGVEADRDQSKRERLEKRIASQQEKLDALHAELQGV